MLLLSPFHGWYNWVKRHEVTCPSYKEAVMRGPWIWWSRPQFTSQVTPVSQDSATMPVCHGLLGLLWPNLKETNSLVLKVCFLPFAKALEKIRGSGAVLSTSLQQSELTLLCSPALLSEACLVLCLDPQSVWVKRLKIHFLKP